MKYGKKVIDIARAIHENGRMKSSEIVEKTRMEKKDVWNSIQTLQRNGFIQKTADNYYFVAKGADIDSLLSGEPVMRTATPMAHIGDPFQKIEKGITNLIDELSNLRESLRDRILTAKQKKEYEDLKRIKENLSKLKFD
jgi:DNA-binding transcriptional regulator GbsR (MarR family)